MTSANPDFEQEVRRNFAQQSVMNLIGASLSLVEPGIVEITLPYRQDLTQQNGYLHAGMITTIADSACGYAAFTLMPPGAGVLSVEFKVNLLRPAKGDSFVARAVRPYVPRDYIDSVEEVDFQSSYGHVSDADL